MMLFRVLPFVDRCPAKSLCIRCDEQPVPSGFQSEEEMVCERQGFVQARFRYGEIDE